ncbi:MAG TPA: response regulator [Burkholderiaceae bacterium]|jgi:two-component system LytT family response regulator
MRVLIVDDELPARDKLRRLLREETDIEAIFEAADGFQALDRVAADSPDVLFLDVQMPEISGLEVAASLPFPAPIIVFVTAFDQYAIRAFDADATDYLLKPYDHARFKRAVQRVRERLERRVDAPDHTGEPEPKAVSSPSFQPLQHLLVSERSVTRVVKVDQIEWIETADNYVILHTAQAHPLLRQTLTSLLAKLGPNFVRCHRRFAVRSDRIERIVALDKGDGELILRGGTRLPYSRQYRAAVLAAMK